MSSPRERRLDREYIREDASTTLTALGQSDGVGVVEIAAAAFREQLIRAVCNLGETIDAAREQRHRDVASKSGTTG